MNGYNLRNYEAPIGNLGSKSNMGKFLEAKVP